MRRLLSLLALAVGMIASAASTGGLGGDGVTGSSGAITTTLDPGASEDNAVDALLDAQIAIADDGLIELTTTFDGESVASVNILLESLTSGEPPTEVAVNTDEQPQVTIGIDAFAGCDGFTPCEEELNVQFIRLDDGDEALSFEWELFGSVSVVSDEEDPVVDGTITFTLAD